MTPDSARALPGGNMRCSRGQMRRHCRFCNLSAFRKLQILRTGNVGDCPVCCMASFYGGVQMKKTLVGTALILAMAALGGCALFGKGNKIKTPNLQVAGVSYAGTGLTGAKLNVSF